MMEMPYEIRILQDTPEDRAQLTALWKACFGEQEEAYIPGFLENMIFAPGPGEILVLQREGELLSMLTLLPATFRRESGEGFPIRYVYAVGTAPGQRRQGLSGMLLEEAKKRYPVSFVLCTFEKELVSYYERFGFRQILSAVPLGIEGPGQQSADGKEPVPDKGPENRSDGPAVRFKEEKTADLSLAEEYAKSRAAAMQGRAHVEWPVSHLLFALRDVLSDGGIERTPEGFLLWKHGEGNHVIPVESAVPEKIAAKRWMELAGQKNAELSPCESVYGMFCGENSVTDGKIGLFLS